MGRILYKQTVVHPEPLTPGLPPAMRSVPLVFPAGKPVPVWRADQIDRAVGGVAARSSGHAALDAELPGGGWPAGGLIELLLPAPGCGELRLLAPALAAASLLWIAPPFTPYAPALAGLGLMIERLTIVTPANAADAAWAAEQALRSGALSAVLWWQGETHTAALPAHPAPPAPGGRGGPHAPVRAAAGHHARAILARTAALGARAGSFAGLGRRGVQAPWAADGGAARAAPPAPGCATDPARAPPCCGSPCT